MDFVLTELERTVQAALYYPAIVLALSLPDICAALESEDGETSGLRYRTWCETWLAMAYPDVTSTDFYSLRCGVVHQGRFGHPNMQYNRVLFTVPNRQGNVFHKNVLNDALNLDAVLFCRDMINVVRKWYSAKQADRNVTANMSRLLRLHPDGLAPYLVGMPLIA